MYHSFIHSFIHTLLPIVVGSEYSLGAGVLSLFLYLVLDPMEKEEDFLSPGTGQFSTWGVVRLADV